MHLLMFLQMEPVMQLKLVSTIKDDPEETSLSGLAGGCCFDFNKISEHLFIVGTEEGKIHKCSIVSVFHYWRVNIIELEVLGRIYRYYFFYFPLRTN